MKGLFEHHLAITSKVLDMRLMRQNVVMSNLANMDTPNYKERRLNFEDDLQRALNLDVNGKLSKTDAGHVPSTFDAATFDPSMKKELPHRIIHGQDNVDMDKEMAAMAKNSLMYNALTMVLKHNFTGLQTAIQEGSK